MMRIQRTQTSLMTQISSFNSKVRYTKEGLGGVTAEEVKASFFISISISISFSKVNIINTIASTILSIIHCIIMLRRCLPFSKTGSTVLWVVSFRSQRFFSDQRRMADENLIKTEIGECLLQMHGHSFTSVGISASQEEMVEVINS